MTVWYTLAVFMAAFTFAIIVFGAVKSLGGAGKDELANRQLRAVRVLTAVWVLLWAAHTAALLLLVHPSPQPYPTDAGTGSLANMLFTVSSESQATSAATHWSFFNILFAMLVFPPGRLPLKSLRTLLYVASVLSAALLLTWPLALTLPTASLILPRDVTLAVSVAGVIGVGAVIFGTPDRTRERQDGSATPEV